MAFGKKILVLILALAVALAAAGCSSNEIIQQDEQPDNPLRRLLFVTDDVEKSFSALAWQNLQNCAAAAGVQVTLLEVQNQADKASTALNQASEGLYDTVILDRLSGETATEWVSRNAGYYPQVKYLCLDAAPEDLPQLDNVTWLIWDDTALYYLYGVLAASNSHSGTVAFFAEESGVRSETCFLAFYAGVCHAAPQARVLYYERRGEQELANTVSTAITEQADVLCCQNGCNVELITQLLTDAQAEPDLLIAGEELTISDLDANPQVLACFWFDMRHVLEDVFTLCCDTGLAAGVQRRTWSNGDVRLRQGDRYPGELEQDALTQYRLVERQARVGTLDTLFAVAPDAEERQQKIAEAAQKGTAEET